MFSAYFATSYFPSGWSGSREAAAPGQMRLFAGGTSTVTISIRGWATSGTVQGGAGSITVPAVGRGIITAVLAGSGALTSTIQGDAGGPTFGNMAISTGGSGSLQATLYQEQTAVPGGGLRFRRPWREPEAARFGDMAAHIEGRGALHATVRGVRVQQPEPVREPVRVQLPPAVSQAQQEPEPEVQAQPAALPTTFADFQVRMAGSGAVQAAASAVGSFSARMGGSGALSATGDLAYDDTEEIALALLMLMRAA